MTRMMILFLISLWCLLNGVLGREDLLRTRTKCGCDPCNPVPTTEETLTLTTTIETTFRPVPPPCVFAPGGCHRWRHHHHHHHRRCPTVTVTSFDTVSITRVCCTITYASTVIQSSVLFTEVTEFTTGSLVIISVSELEAETITALSTQTQTSLTTTSTTTTLLTTTMTTQTFNSFTISRSATSSQCPRCRRPWMDCGCHHHDRCRSCEEEPIVISTVQYVTQTRTVTVDYNNESDYDDDDDDDDEEKEEEEVWEKSFDPRDSKAQINGAIVEDSKEAGEKHILPQCHRPRVFTSTWVSAQTILTTIWPSRHGCPRRDSTVFILPLTFYQTSTIEVVTTVFPPPPPPPCYRCPPLLPPPPPCVRNGCHECEIAPVDPCDCMYNPRQTSTTRTSSTQPLNITSTVQSITIVLSTQTNTVYWASTIVVGTSGTNGSSKQKSMSPLLWAMCLGAAIGFFI